MKQLLTKVQSWRSQRRSTGLPHSSRQKTPRPIEVVPNACDRQKLVLDWIKIGLTALGVGSMWLIFWLRPLAPIALPVPSPALPRPLPASLRYAQ